MIKFLPAVAFAAVSLAPTILLADDTALPRVVGMFDYKAGEGAEQQETEFEEVLSRHVGERVYLELSLLPTESIRALEVSRMAAPGEWQARELACGVESELGFIDNVTDSYRITFQPPYSNHALYDVVIGNRLTFPEQSLLCSTENYTSQESTPLRISGYFYVDRTDVPTAYTYLLIPVNP